MQCCYHNYSKQDLNFFLLVKIKVLATVIRVGPRDRRTGLSGGNTRVACARYSTLTYDTSIV